MIYSLSRLLEILFFGIVDIDKLLGIAIDQRKPAALHLNHDSMSFSEYMENVGHLVFDLGDLSWDKGFRISEAVSEFSAEQLSTHQLLESSHPGIPPAGTGHWPR